MRSMARIMTPVWMVVAVGLSCSIVLGQAQDAKAPDPKPSPKQPPKPPQKEEFLPVDKILTQAVKNIAVRYNLNAEQHEFTDQLMTREVHKFLREHRQEVWPVLRDLIRWQM